METLQSLQEHFISLPSVAPQELIGLWHGGAWYTGSVFCTLLEHTGWWGKEFRSEDEVDALLFARDSGGALESAGALVRQPLAAINALTIIPWNLPPRGAPTLLRHPLGRASVRRRRLFGTESAAMCYRYVPITDHFRRMENGRLMGYMEIAGSGRPELFFWLERSGGHRCVSCYDDQQRGQA